MDEDISIINSNTRNEKIKNFFINNKKLLILTLTLLILTVISYFGYSEIQANKNKNLALKYNNTIIKFDPLNKLNIKNELIEIIYEKNSTYSPLALYFIIDNEIQASNEEINNYFDVLINDTDADEEVKNLILYKKGLFNADFTNENNLIAILKPIINSDSIWKSHALYLIAEFFFHKNQKQKAKEFFNQIIKNEKSNAKIVSESKKRLIRDFNE
tara:strand:- start:136 stop:780 length:645 start_codon:yes stop_codon:yes gene_type:complete